MQNNEIFKVVLSTKSKAKNGTSTVLIETSIKGLIYRSEVYMDDHIIDALEVNCSDIATVDKHENVFQARYTVAHKKFETLYTQERIFAKVLTTDGDYIEGDGIISVITSVSDNVFKSEVFLDSNSIDIKKEEIDGDDPKVFKAKYTQSHKEFIKSYIKVLKFPANTFLNPIIKKYPLYKKSPMYALMLFLASIALVLWILSLILCGKALKKIIVKVAGKEAGMVTKDLQKSMCKGGGAEGDPNVVLDKDGNVISAKASDFVLLPKEIKFKDNNRIYPVYIKNNKQSDVLIRLKDRIIFLGEAINDHVANILIAQFLFLDAESKEKDIKFYINTPGGSVSAGMAIYDTMQYVKADVSTICVGMAASMGATLLAAGAKGSRFTLPNSEVMIHQVMGGTEGQASDIKIRAEHILKIRDRLNKILAKHTGQKIATIEKDTDRDRFMTAEEAKKYGIVDKIIS